MVSVQAVFNNVLAISRKGSTGYSSSEDFNAQQRLVQDMLFAYYFERYEQDQAIPDSLRPFMKHPTLACTLGNVNLPADYRHRLECEFLFIAGANTTPYPCPYLAANEEAETKNSYVRKPDAVKRRFYHTLAATTIKVHPSITGALKLKYLAAPADAVYAVTVNTTDYVEDFNAGASIDFAWEAQDEVNLVDIFLFLKGISTRQSELLTWVAQKRQITS